MIQRLRELSGESVLVGVACLMTISALVIGGFIGMAVSLAHLAGH